MKKGKPEAPIAVYVDGASRGNPGPAGAGFVIVDGEGGLLEEGSRYLGERTNNQAEYEALILALTRVRDLGLRRVRVLSDSELLVRQMRGEYRIKSEGLRPLFRKAADLFDSIGDVEIVRVSRSDNRRADQLANFSIDRNR